MLGKYANCRIRGTMCALVVAGTAAATGFGVGKFAAAREAEPRISPLLASGQTVTGEAINYPAGAAAKITALVLTLQPGEETGWHTHGVPAFGYMLEGELSVEYTDKTVRTYKAGDALLEAMSVGHNGRNSGSGRLRILAVFMGAEGKTISDAVSR